MTQDAAKPSKIFLGYAVDIVAPTAAYFLLHALGVSDFGALILGSIIALSSTAVNTFRRKRLDKVGILVIIEITLSIALLFVTRNPRFLLIKPSFYTGITAIYLISTSFRGRPLTYEPVKAIAAKGGALRTAAFERAWETRSDFRLALRMSAFGWAIALLADAVLRVVIIYQFPVSRAVWMSNLPNLAAIVLLIAFSALMGRKTKRIVDETVAATVAPLC